MISNELYSHYLNALLQGDMRRCSAIVAGLLEINTDIATIYTEFFQKALYQVGELWETNRISVAVELIR